MVQDPSSKFKNGLLVTWKQRTPNRVCPEHGSMLSPLQMHRPRPLSCRVSLIAGPELLIPPPHHFPLKNCETHRVSRANTCPCKSKAMVGLAAFSADAQWPHIGHRASQFSPQICLSVSQPSNCLPAALGHRRL